MAVPVQPNQTQPNQVVQQAVLQSLYAVFLGGIITAFLVIGLTTFYPPPPAPEDQTTAIDRDLNELYACQADPACKVDEARLRQLEAQREEVWQRQQDDQRAWSRNAGLALIGLATGLLALSLVRSDRVIVLSNGMLLGGLFTMVGGIGLSIAGGEGVARFLVLSAALAITVVLGYLRFARQPVASAVSLGGPAGDVDLRVAAVEARLDAVHRALGG